MDTAFVTSKQQRTWREIRDYLMIALAMTCYSIGWTVFLLPNHITTGGVPGIASVVFWATGINVQYTYFVINGLLLIAAFIILGWKFVVKTVFAVVWMTLFLPIVQHATDGWNLLHDQPFMACVIGAALCGSGVGIALSNNGSSGGTDIVAAIVNKYRDITLGRVILLTDVIIISSSYFVLHNWEMLIYGYAALFICSFMVDQVVNSARQSVQFFIVSKKYEEIGRHINKDLHRGVTYIDGVGAYTGLNVKMMFVLAKKRESTTIFRLIKDIDPNAFVSQSAVIGVFGEGFDKIKVK
ncbi:YitT family protein [Phocaeicola oris]|uniref:YitT family protein n=1 Tax=Phocaeicola oris TaxID=2896850 RepID=UPI00234EBDE3|nr:YitT family protein [Phocaeicola oris]MCE2617414.1 YitT family protein [Phocaeicola oris]